MDAKRIARIAGIPSTEPLPPNGNGRRDYQYYRMLSTIFRLLHGCLELLPVWKHQRSMQMMSSGHIVVQTPTTTQVIGVNMAWWHERETST
mmetsp:Transcript_16665/g.21769  ORF Transcript_16665/g.21769 Transcript_16665/m.21769 type:complete len:91 (+) Transcript_16665:340-612(+)